MLKPSVQSISVKKFKDDLTRETNDLLAVEEPLEIRLSYGRKNDRKQKSISVTMRTPGHDFELAIGFLFTEAVVNSKEEILSIKYCEQERGTPAEQNIVLVELQENVFPDIKRLERNFYTSSSCGVCGKASIDAVRNAIPKSGISEDQRFFVSSEEILALPEKLYAEQLVFSHTGGLHAAALFDDKGEILLLREDVGRHNALDKLIGASLQLEKIPLNKNLLFLSGRSSFELVQKAAMAGIKIIASVGAPSSLAVSVAKEFGITLIGFVRDNRFNVYCGQERIKD